jgi:hypothetical protein
MGRQFVIPLILAGLVGVVGAPLTCGAQTVYSVRAGVFSIGQVQEHDWTFGSHSIRFGFQQFRQHQDSSGNNLYDYNDVKTRSVAAPRYTTILAGSIHLTIRGPAWVAALALATVLAFIASLMSGVLRKTLSQGRE